MSIQVTPRRRRGVVGSAAIVVAVGGVMAVAGPAAAHSDPPVFTVTPAFLAAEDLGNLTFGGECSTGSDGATVSWMTNGTSQMIVPSLDGTGQFSAGTYAIGGGAGDSVPVTLTCYSGPTVLATQVVTVVYPDLGASLTGAATVVVDQNIVPSYDCGTPIAGALTRVYLEVRDPANNAVSAPLGLPIPTGSASAIGTPASLGLAVGDVATVNLMCFVTDGPLVYSAGSRSYQFTVIAPATPPGGNPGGGIPGTPGGGTTPVAPSAGNALPDTGVDALPLVTAGAALLLAGLVLARRRRAA